MLPLFSTMLNPFRRSLALSATLTIALAAACGVLMTLMLAQRLVGDRLEHEAKAIEALAERQLLERFQTEIGYGRFRLSMLAAALEDSAALIATDSRTQQALRTGDPRLAREAIAADLASLGFSDGLLFDYQLKLVGSALPQAKPEQADSAFRRHSLAETMDELLDRAASGTKGGLRRLIPIDQDMSAFLATREASAGILIAVPVMNREREPLGVLLAIRPLQWHEPLLADLARTTGTGLTLFGGNVAVSRSGEGAMEIPSAKGPDEHVFRDPVSGRVSLCGAIADDITLCLCRPIAEINAYRDEMTAIGIAQSGRTTLLLMVSGAFGLILLALVALQAARFFTRPLTEMTGTVDLIARGKFDTPIQYADREDEIGRISRALIGMRDKLAERDRLRAEMARIDAINQRRRMMGDALERAEMSYGHVIQKLGGTARAMREIEAAIDNARAAADRERERITTSSVATASSAHLVSGATLMLSERISEIGARSRETRDALLAGSAQVEVAGEALHAARAIAGRAGHETANLRDAVSDLSAHLLRLTHETSTTDGMRGSEARAFADVTAAAQDAAIRISSEIAALDDLVEDTAVALDRSRGEFDAARVAAGDIVVTAAEQGAVTRDVAIGLAGAAEALANLSTAVDALQAHLLGAHGATDQFSGIARQMIADAEAIDAGIRSFLRDAAG